MANRQSLLGDVGYGGDLDPARLRSGATPEARAPDRWQPSAPRQAHPVSSAEEPEFSAPATAPDRPLSGVQDRRPQPAPAVTAAIGTLS